MSTSDADLHAAPGAVDPVASEVADVAHALGVDPEQGLSSAQVQERLASTGPNRLAEGKTESGFRAFLRQYEDFMQVVLLVAAAVNQIVTGETGTTVVLAGLTVFNAVIGLRQEAKAEESVKALAQMMRTIARVRRDGQSVEIDADELVPGDVVLVEAGNRVPADARVYVAATLEIEEAALTGESLPVGKSVEPVLGDEVPLGDRTCMAYMNTSVTRGRGELIVTATGMATEIGHIADMLASTETSKTPVAEAAGRPEQDHRHDRRHRAGARRTARPGPGRVLRHPVHHRRRPGCRGDPDGSARGGHRPPVDGYPRDRTAERDRQAPAGGRDPGVDLGHLLGQDRHPDPEQDDGSRDRDPRPEPLHGLRRGLQHRGRDQPRRRSALRPRSLSAARRSCAPTRCSTART